MKLKFELKENLLIFPPWQNRDGRGKTDAHVHDSQVGIEEKWFSFTNCGVLFINEPVHVIIIVGYLIFIFYRKRTISMKIPAESTQIKQISKWNVRQRKTVEQRKH